MGRWPPTVRQTAERRPVVRTAWSRQQRHPFAHVSHVGMYSRTQKSRTPTVPKEFQIGLYDPTEADLEHLWNCCSAGFLRERLYSRSLKNLARQLSQNSYKLAFTGSQRPICKSGATVGVRGFCENVCISQQPLRTAVLPKILHCNRSKSVPNRPLQGRRGRFGTGTGDNCTFQNFTRMWCS